MVSGIGAQPIVSGIGMMQPMVGGIAAQPLVSGIPTGAIPPASLALRSATPPVSGNIIIIICTNFLLIL